MDQKAENYSFGANGRTNLLAGSKLDEIGVNVGDYKSKFIFEGFSYQGMKFPQKIRIYLSPDNKIPDKRKAYILYAYYEKKWGKDLSWVKAVPLQVIQ